MALVNCPECGKEVSEHATACPNCGFGIKENILAKKDQQAAYDNFVKNHRNFTTTDKGWYKLFSAYEYMVNKVEETTKALGNYQIVWFDSGVPSYPLDFCNGWFGCINNTYFEIINRISAIFSDFPDEQIQENLAALQSYKYITVVRTILARWHSLLMDPFENNSPAILKQANNRYATEIAQKSEMDFGVVTNSIPEQDLAIAFTESENAGKLPATLVEQRHDVRKYLVEHSKLPPEVKIFITTSQNKEGISIREHYQKESV